MPDAKPQNTPLLIAIDTSTDWCSVGVGVPGDLQSKAEKLGQGHSKHVLGMLDDLLKQNGLTVADASAVAFGAGPGSFTGLRIACGVAQGLAFGANLPVISISTISIVAQRWAGQAQATVALYDARMGELYGAVFGPDGAQLTPDFVANAHDSVLMIEQALNGQAFNACGNAWALPLAPIQLLGAKAVQVDSLAYPQANWLLGLGFAAFKAGRLLPPELAVPNYIRNNVALNSMEQQALRAAKLVGLGAST
jgi:tRNA threonylcarbamoyladenosine biosynthesis protein TsaB